MPRYCLRSNLQNYFRYQLVKDNSNSTRKKKPYLGYYDEFSLVTITKLVSDVCGNCDSMCVSMIGCYDVLQDSSKDGISLISCNIVITKLSVNHLT